MHGPFQRVWQRLRPVRPRPLILMYHRIATPAVDPWELAVSPRHFAEQLAVLRRTRVVMPLSDLVGELQRGTVPPNAIGVTFDDGYVDNLTSAAPMLLDAGVAATLFVATGFLDQARAYWWDELAELLLAGRTPIECELSVGREQWRVSVGPIADDASARSWRAWQPPVTERQRAYTETYRRIRAASASDRERVVAALRQAAGVTALNGDARPMRTDELVRWSAGHNLDVGAHTSTHPLLPAIEAADCEREIAESKEVCERLVNRTIVGFAYPHGGHDDHVRRTVAHGGFAWACTTEARALEREGLDVYALPRLAVANCDGPSFERSLRAACVE